MSFPTSHRFTSHYLATNECTTVARTSSCGLMMTFHSPIHVPPNTSSWATENFESNMYLQWSAAIQTEACDFSECYFLLISILQSRRIICWFVLSEGLCNLKNKNKNHALQRSLDYSFTVFYNKVWNSSRCIWGYHLLWFIFGLYAFLTIWWD